MPRRGAVLLTWTAAAALAVARPGTAGACSVIPPAMLPHRPPGSVEFVATPTPDSVRAGVGPVRAPRAGVAAGDAGPVYGYLVRVDALSAAAPPDVRAVVRRAGGRVVLVPWSYGPDCAPERWTGSARWLADPVGGWFVAVPRAPALWAGGVPTFDVFAPYHLPYRGRRQRPLGDSGEEPGVALSPHAVLALRATLPVGGSQRAASPTRYDGLRRWLAAHPADSARYPVADMVRWARREGATF